MNPMDDTTAATPPQPSSRVFPTPGSNLYRILFDPAFKQSFHDRLKTYNPFIVALYRVGLLPLFGAGRSIMLLTTKGRKSGKDRHFPVGYFRIGGALYVFSAWGKAAGWYKNLVAYPNDVRLQLGMRKSAVRAQVLEDPAEKQRTLEQLIAESPQAANNLFGWQPGRDSLEHADFSPLIQQVVIVRFSEESQGK